jgi:hypothetical protein
MTDLYQNHHVTKALDVDQLTLRGIDLQAMAQDTRAEINRVRDVIRSTRNSGSFDFITARRQAAERLAEAALTGIELPDEAIAHAPSDTNLKLTIEGLNGRLAELERKLSQIKSEHRVVIINLAQRHIDEAGTSYLAAREAYVHETAKMMAIDQALANAGLPVQNAIYVQNNCELPILLSEKKPSEAGWTIRLNYLTEPHLRAMPQSYRDSLAQLGLTLKLEG